MWTGGEGGIGGRWRCVDWGGGISGGGVGGGGIGGGVWTGGAE